MQRVQESIRVNAPVEKVYQYWRNFENFPDFMNSVEEVRVSDPSGEMSHWKLKGPMGMSPEFDARMTQDIPNQSIGWNSTGGSIETTGSVTFTEVEQDTEVNVVMQWYDPPAGALGEAVGKLLQDQDKMLAEDLRRFKDIVEGRVGSGSRQDS